MSLRVGVRAIELRVGGHRVEVPCGTAFSIGRHGTNHLVLADTEASRFHARIVWRDDAAWIEDQSSLNGTFVDGVRLRQPVELRDQQRVRIGASLLTVHLVEEDALPALLPATREELSFFEEWRRQEVCGAFQRQLELHRLLLDLQAEQRTGTLELRLPGGSATLVLKQGLIAAAALDDGQGRGRRGLAAFEALLRCSAGSYRFGADFEPQDGSLDLSVRDYLRRGPWAQTRRHARG